MAPSRAVAVDKENRQSNREVYNFSKSKSKDNIIATSCGEEKSPVTPRCQKGVGLAPQTGMTRRMGGAPNQKGNHNDSIKSRLGTQTGNRAPARTGLDPWATVKTATLEADKLEAELAALQAKAREAEAEVLEAEAAARGAEEDFTTRSAAMLAEYTTEYEKHMELESKLASAKETLCIQRADNLQLSQRNIELDREARHFKEHINEAEALLEQCTKSQFNIDAEIAEKKASCEWLRKAAQNQGERLAIDFQRFAAMKARLFEVCDPMSPQNEAQQLIADADIFMARTQQAQKDCEEIVRDGLVPCVAPQPMGPHDSDLNSPIEATASQCSNMVTTVAMPVLLESTDEFAGVESF